MTARTVRLGVVDSGVASGQGGRIADAAAFVLAEEGVRRAPPVADMLGHGGRVTSILAYCAPQADLFVAQVFRERPTTTAAQVAAAVDWLLAQDVHVINLSLGLHEPRAVLAEACARAVAAGVILCAASPARGDAVYPAAFDGLLRATGDARCARMEISAIATSQADFGAHVRPLDGTFHGSGASMGSAHVSGHICRYLTEGGPANRAAVHAWLVAQARYHGPQRPGSRVHEH